jgi:hypothetical protein
MAVAVTARVLLTEALQDIRVLAAGEVLDDTEGTDALRKLTRLFDNWNAERAGVYASTFTTHTLVPDLQPHTIGPSTFTPTFTVTQRPVSIEWANIVVGSGEDRLRYRLALRNSYWYGDQPMPGLTSNLPLVLYYSPDWPLGKLYLWPVPSAAYGLELQTRIVLADLGLDDTVSLPPGYRDALTLTLGEMLAPSHPPAVADPVAAAKARARIFANNDVQPRLMTADYGTGRGPGTGWSIINTLRGY